MRTFSSGALIAFFSGLLIAVVGAILMFSYVAALASQGGLWEEGGDWTAEDEAFWEPLFFAGLFLLFAGPIVFWLVLPVWRLWRRRGSRQEQGPPS